MFASSMVNSRYRMRALLEADSVVKGAEQGKPRRVQGWIGETVLEDIPLRLSSAQACSVLVESSCCQQLSIIG